MYSRSQLYLFSLVLFYLTVPCPPAESSIPIPLKDDDYMIVGEVLKNNGKEMSLQWVSVVRFTRRPARIDCLKDQDTSAQWQSAVMDLEAKNSSIFVVESKFDLPFRYELADELKPVGYTLDPPPGKDREEFAKETREEFRKRREEGYTQLQFSAPGVSTDGNTAIVYSAVSYAGQYNVLYKRDNVWVMDIRPLCGWIS